MANEKRLIDANALLKKAIWGKLHQGMVYESDAKVVTTGAIATAPTVDAVEVVHGRWIEHIEIGAMNNHYECSACHWKTPSFTIAKDSNYCPNCGAKMDGDGNG